MRFEELENCYLDTKTGIQWSKENFGPMTWDEAMGSPTGWRLPMVEELLTIVDYNRLYPATELPGMLLSYYWSSTTYANYSGDAWCVYFGNGDANYCDKSGAYQVRYVKEN